MLASFGTKADRMDLKGVIADHMGHFSARDLPNVVFMLVAALVLGYLTSFLGARRGAAQARGMALWSTLAALAAALVRSQLPLATLVLAAAVLVGKREEKASTPELLTMLLIGIGCGSGASVVVGVLLVVFIPIMRWAGKGSTEA